MYLSTEWWMLYIQLYAKVIWWNDLIFPVVLAWNWRESDKYLTWMFNSHSCTNVSFKPVSSRSTRNDPIPSPHFQWSTRTIHHSTNTNIPSLSDGCILSGNPPSCNRYLCTSHRHYLRLHLDMLRRIQRPFWREERESDQMCVLWLICVWNLNDIYQKIWYNINII